MNLIYIETALANMLSGSPEFTVAQAHKLLLEVMDYRSRESSSDSIHNALPILDSYYLDYGIAIEEYNFLAKNGSLEQKETKVQEILCLLSCLDYFLTSLLNRHEDLKSLSAVKKGTDYTRQFMAKKEEIISDKFLYSDIQKSLRNRLWSETKQAIIKHEKNKIT